MVNFIIHRPIAVIMSCIALIVFGLIAITLLPVSLLPSIDVPSIIIKIRYPGASPAEIEQNVLEPIRQNMLTLNGLKDLESNASSETGKVELKFAYGTAMNLAYIAVNEKIDQLTTVFPQDLPRPQVVKISTADIPVMRLQVIPKVTDNLIEVSELTEKLLKRRLEQVEGISLIEISGKQNQTIFLTPNTPKMLAFNIDNTTLIKAVRDHNQSFDVISLKDGQYRYNLKLATSLDNIESIGNIPIAVDSGQFIRLKELVRLQRGTEKIDGYHLFNGGEGLVITLHKQAQASMYDVMPQVYEIVENFKQEYPQINFAITQDQSTLLTVSIHNLQTSILFGGAFAFAVLFIFMGNFRTPIIIGISLPVSMIIGFLLFYLFDISINIISLSGLALGLGMLIDSAIIVLDNINRYHLNGFSLLQSCVKGTEDVIMPLISSVLTTLAVFVPLVFLGGIAGTLFFDQAVSVATILSVSLLVAFILLPLLYGLLHQKKTKKIAIDSGFFLKVLMIYKKVYDFCFYYKKFSLIFLLFLIPGFFLVGFLLPVEGLPHIEKKESLLQVNWNEPISVKENKDRVEKLISRFRQNTLLTETDIGHNQFLLQQENNSIDYAEIYLLFETSHQKQQTESYIAAMLTQNYPAANFKLQDPPNAFQQLFSNEKPFFEVRVKDYDQNRPIEYNTFHSYLDSIERNTLGNVNQGLGFVQETTLTVFIYQDKLSLYGIPYKQLQEKLDQIFGDYRITDLKRFSEVTTILLKASDNTFKKMIQTTYLQGANGTYYPLAEFVMPRLTTDYKHITSDRTGIYQNLEWKVAKDVVNNDVGQLKSNLEKSLGQRFMLSFSGQYFENQDNIRQLAGILIISVLLLYFILAAQFESFLQPLIVMATLPLGLGGSLLLLWITGTSLNLMSAIGMIVVLGIIVNDAILKIDTINRLHKEHKQLKNSFGNEEAGAAIPCAISVAGEMRLKPILMTSITTILAVLPVLFTSGVGADLQKPLVISIIGGLTFGTFTALYFIPLAYYYVRSIKI